MKKVIGLLLTALVLVNTNLPCMAAESEDVNKSYISIEEYEKAVQEECAKYDIECKVLDYDPTIVITQEMVDDAILNARIYAESIEVQSSGDFVVDTFKDVSVDEGASVYAMPVTQNVYGSMYISNVYGYANFTVKANVTVNVQNSAVMSVNSTEVYQEGSFMNYQGWETTSISSKLNSPSTGYITVNVTGRATFSYADPVTGITTGYTSTESKSVKINCN